MLFDLFGKLLQTESIDWPWVSGPGGPRSPIRSLKHYNMQKSLEVTVNRSSNVDSIKPLADVGDAEPKCMVVFSWALIAMGGQGRQ